jgi:hypothetical protein
MSFPGPVPAGMERQFGGKAVIAPRIRDCNAPGCFSGNR